MTNEERDRLLAWLDEQIDKCQEKKDEMEMGSPIYTPERYATLRGAMIAFYAVKAHLQAESEAANDEA